MKKALIISCNDNYDYETRTKYVERFFLKNGYGVEYLVADFDHRNKVKYEVDRSGKIEYVHVPTYKKNISIGRLWSHICFGRGVKEHVMSNNFDLVYHCAPPNYTIKKLSECKKEKNFKLITEIGDMWPETMPISATLKKALVIPFSVWAGLRDKNLYNSDAIITECNLFKEMIEKKTTNEHIKTMYFCKHSYNSEPPHLKNISSCIELCYLGSLNNIVDISMIGRTIGALAKKRRTLVHIIGGGERHDEFVKRVSENGGEVVDHGMIFEDEKKGEIISQCHFGLNMMVSQVCVGMTMKSLDYFSFGIPMINNIHGDGWNLIQAEHTGINLDADNFTSSIMNILEMDMSTYMKMREGVKLVHQKYFSVSCFEKMFSNLLTTIE